MSKAECHVVVDRQKLERRTRVKCLVAGGRASLKTTWGGLLVAHEKQVLFYRVTSADLRWLADSLATREAHVKAKGGSE